jgi:ribosomal protein L16 Arg81 hydroxylase
LFIGPKGSQSALHVDQLHTNFYMILMEGRKRWVFFEPEDVPLLYPTWVRGQLDPSFQPLHLTLTDDAKPLAAAARRRECVLNAGEVLFVPAGEGLAERALCLTG